MPNTRRMNRLEELGRVDSEKADTKKGKKNLKAEKKRIVRELRKGGGMSQRGLGKGIIQDNTQDQTMMLNSGGLANLFRVKTQ